MKPLILTLIALSFFSYISCTSNLRLDKDPNKSFSMFESFSSFSSFNSNGGKPEKHFKSMSTEEYREKEGDNPEQVRKYGESFEKNNEELTKFKRKASSNVEEEQVILDAMPSKERMLKEEEEKQFLDGGQFLKNFHHSKPNLKHGRYDKYLEDRKKKLIAKANSLKDFKDI
jgi:hypothetical protein